jgi:hypothetical protein
MSKLILGNRDYGPPAERWGAHTSDEGYQLQAGLVAAGWEICGNGYGDNCTEVDVLLERFTPEAVFVQDVRDWLPESPICFRDDVGFRRIEALGASGIPAFTVLKDAWGWPEIQSKLAEDIHARGIVTYYHHDAVRRVAPWTAGYALHRIYHSVDADLIRSLPAVMERKRGIVTGANAECYPLRRMAIRQYRSLEIDVRPHPGYSNRASDTTDYLAAISQYKVHVATASQWEVAFRKIIESVACGCTPVTNLPAYDVLPEIDGALYRVPSNCTADELKWYIDEAESLWNFDERQAWAERAMAYYDWRVAGQRLSDLIDDVVELADADTDVLEVDHA